MKCRSVVVHILSVHKTDPVGAYGDHSSRNKISSIILSKCNENLFQKHNVEAQPGNT
jgi:hypothetical protein